MRNRLRHNLTTSTREAIARRRAAAYDSAMFTFKFAFRFKVIIAQFRPPSTVAAFFHQLMTANFEYDLDFELGQEVKRYEHEQRQYNRPVVTMSGYLGSVIAPGSLKNSNLWGNVTFGEQSEP